MQSWVIVAFFLTVFNRGTAMSNESDGFNWPLSLATFFLALVLSACSTINAVPPEVNLMRVDVLDVTLSHVNLLADLRVFNPNEKDLTIQGVDYTLRLEGIKVFSGRSNMRETIAPQQYGHLTLRLSGAYWNLIQLINKLPNTSDVAFSMQGSIRIGKSYLFAHRYSFATQGTIPLNKTTP